MAKQLLEAQNPLILRCNRLMEAFAKSDDERDFYLDKQEGFIVYVNLDRPDEELEILEKELEKNPDRYCSIPKLTFYETKKIMEGFVNEKVYDIDTKEKLIDIIQSKEARENFLEFIYDHHSELEKWQTYYQERSRIRIIEWLRINHFHFVFEEDLELPKNLLEKLKKELFSTKVGKDVLTARKTLVTKSKTYYSNEALNPRPKRGRPPKQIQKTEIEHHPSTDIYTTVPAGLRPFLFNPDHDSTAAATFSEKFGTEDSLFANRNTTGDNDLSMSSLNQKLAALRSLSSKWVEKEEPKTSSRRPPLELEDDFSFDDDEDDDDDDDDELPSKRSSKKKTSKAPPKAAAKTPPTKKAKTPPPVKKAAAKKAPPAKVAKKAAAPKKKAPLLPAPKSKKRASLRPIKKLKKK